MLNDYMQDRLGEDERELVRAHLSSCAECGEIYRYKQAIFFDRDSAEKSVPDDIASSFAASVVAGFAAAREGGGAGRSWASRYLMPAMAAAIALFIFITGFMLSEIRHLRGENSGLRGEVAAMETALYRAGEAKEGRGAVFSRLSGGRMTVGEAVRILEYMPEGTTVLTEREAERMIAGDRRLSRYAGHMGDKPWEGGLTSTELLLLISVLEIDHGTRIPADWRAGERDI
jgi:hypothetical protein